MKNFISPGIPKPRSSQVVPAPSLITITPGEATFNDSDCWPTERYFTYEVNKELRTNLTEGISAYQEFHSLFYTDSC